MELFVVKDKDTGKNLLVTDDWVMVLSKTFPDDIAFIIEIWIDNNLVDGIFIDKHVETHYRWQQRIKHGE